MGLNIDKLRQKLKDTQERMNMSGGDFKFWAPKDGRNVIRILPPKEGSDDFYAEARVHYNVGPNNKMVTCGKTDRGSCIVCDYVDALYKTKDKDDEKLAKKMRATSRYYFNVVDRSVEEDSEEFGEVLVFGSGATIFTDILGIIVDPDFGDITNPDEGRDIIITKSGKGLDTEYKTQARPKETSVGIDDWGEKMIDLSMFTKSKSDEDMEAILEGREPSKDEEKEDKKDEKRKPLSSSSNKPKNGKKKPEPEEEDDPEGEPEEEFDEDEADEIEKEIQAVLKKHKK